MATFEDRAEIFSGARTLSEAISALRYENDSISAPQFEQLMQEQDGDDGELPSVRLSLLDVSEVESSLCLKPAKTSQGLNFFPTTTVPDLLTQTLEMVDRTLSDKSATAGMRLKMNTYLLLAYNTAMDSCSEQEELPQIDCEPKWSFGPVQYQDQAVKLSGRPSYALWYGDKEEAESNLIVTQSLRHNVYDAGVAEVLGYMGSIHHHRKNAEKADYPIYGVATDSKMFHFVRLDSDSTFVTATLDSEVDLERAFSLLVHFFKEAMLVRSIQPEGSSMGSNKGEGSAEPLISPGFSLRRTTAKETQYEELKDAAADLGDVDYYDIELWELEQQFPADETSEDECFEDE